MRAAGGAPVGVMMFNSLVMALAIAIGKIAISIISAFAIVYFRFPFRMGFFWIIFLTLMLPVEVRILPTYEVVAGFGMLDTRSEEHTSELQSLMRISYAVFCLKKKN